MLKKVINTALLKPKAWSAATRVENLLVEYIMICKFDNTYFNTFVGNK